MDAGKWCNLLLALLPPLLQLPLVLLQLLSGVHMEFLPDCVSSAVSSTQATLRPTAPWQTSMIKAVDMTPFYTFLMCC